MDIRVLFGRNVRRLRRRAKMSQTALGALVGADRAHISLIERGLQNVTLLTLWHVSVALDVQPADLLRQT
jgi:transcriptional regulator with XRE-family HTH domain